MGAESLVAPLVVRARSIHAIPVSRRITDRVVVVGTLTNRQLGTDARDGSGRESLDVELGPGVDGRATERRSLDSIGPTSHPEGCPRSASHLAWGGLAGRVERRPASPRPCHEPVEKRASSQHESDGNLPRTRSSSLEARVERRLACEDVPRQNVDAWQ